MEVAVNQRWKARFIYIFWDLNYVVACNDQEYKSKMIWNDAAFRNDTNKKRVDGEII